MLVASSEIDLTIEEDAYTLSSTKFSVSTTWSDVKSLVKTQHYWLLYTSRDEALTLPTDCIPKDLQTFVEERVQASGGEIVAIPKDDS